MLVLKRARQQDRDHYVGGIGAHGFLLVGLDKARKFKDVAELIQFVSTYRQAYSCGWYEIMEVELIERPQWREVRQFLA